ncbi:unnamed protein product [Fraxinus pennsylvanica]|uniref:Uncharacterized protein n=1 Tax=Fraxinus pennsylvanica TaxID=56036 RepID=A0AAD2E1P2_9LAMI|nr:unnamed protein product [Fraxinus pennsylvanica]
MAAVVGCQEQKIAVTNADYAEDFEDQVAGFNPEQSVQEFEPHYSTTAGAKVKYWAFRNMLILFNWLQGDTKGENAFCDGIPLPWPLKKLEFDLNSDGGTGWALFLPNTPI